MGKNIETFIHETATIEDSARIGKGCKIWINVQIRENAVVGENTIVGKDVYIDAGVQVGKNCKIQNGASLYYGMTVDDDVFIGPNACFTNDKTPRAFNSTWKITATTIDKGASIGANATIVCGVIIGEYSMVGAGSVVTRDVEPYSLVIGNPARHHSYVDKMGNKVAKKPK